MKWFKWYVVTDGITTKVTELFANDKQTLLEPGYRIICDKNGYKDFNSAFTSMIMSMVYQPMPSELSGREVAVEMLSLP